MHASWRGESWLKFVQQNRRFLWLWEMSFTHVYIISKLGTQNQEEKIKRSDPISSKCDNFPLVPSAYLMVLHISYQML